MIRHLRRAVWLGALAALAVGLGACGSDDESGTPATQAKSGGKLTVLSAGDFIDVDCGKAYYQYDYQLCYATQRPLYSYKPDDGATPVPDLAANEAEVSDDGKTITVKIKKGIRFSTPVNREVTSKDVKYALERQFFSTVATGYAGPYFGTIVGAKTGAKPGTKIRGIETPDDQTLVIRLENTTAASVIKALALPGSAPVPEEYARKFDAKTPSTYKNYQVATGPYMIKQDSKGKATGYKPGKSMVVVRNPAWDKDSDFRPAPLDGFTFRAGGDPAVMAKQVLQGKSLINGDWAPLPPDIRLALRTRKDQIVLDPSAAFRYVAMNTSKKPFNDVNVRRAVLAGFDRKAMQLSRGGDPVGEVASHFLTPGFPGFEEAGGRAGPDLDFVRNPRGDLNVAAKYFRAAGFKSGKYEGNEELLMIGVNTGVGKKAAEVAQQQFEKLGFNVKLREVTPDAMYSRFCQIPKSGYDICPNVAWAKDFYDGQTMLDVPFNGRNIVEESNSNHALFDDPEINAQMEKAKLIIDEDERAKAWAAIDVKLMEKVAAIPWLWDKQGNIASADVAAVLSDFNTDWDLSFTGLKG